MNLGYFLNTHKDTGGVSHQTEKNVYNKNHLSEAQSVSSNKLFFVKATQWKIEQDLKSFHNIPKSKKKKM